MPRSAHTFSRVVLAALAVKSEIPARTSLYAVNTFTTSSFHFLATITSSNEEGSEKTYYKAFEEGRAYEAGLDVEDLERRESGFDPREYDEDYDENY